jgi:hypothetical protein
LCDFWYNAHVRAMKKARSQEIKKWKRYRPKYVIDHNQAMYIQFVETERFTMCSKSSKQNQNKKNHCLISKHIGRTIMFTHHAKCLVRVHCDIFSFFFLEVLITCLLVRLLTNYLICRKTLWSRTDFYGVIWGNSYQEEG